MKSCKRRTKGRHINHGRPLQRKHVLQKASECRIRLHLLYYNTTRREAYRPEVQKLTEENGSSESCLGGVGFIYNYCNVLHLRN